jgi:large subunit ribosomal protein L6
LAAKFSVQYGEARITMSRIGNTPIEIASGAEATIADSKVMVKGPKGALEVSVPDVLDVKIEDGKIIVSRKGETRLHKSQHGLIRTLIANMVTGVTQGFIKELEIQGVGFKAILAGTKLTLSLGYSHTIELVAPDGVNIEVTDATKLKIEGADKQKVGETAAKIRAYYPAEPYKGKGVRYKGEYVRRKEGKTVA